MNNLKFSLTRDVPEPIREHPTDAGIDVFLPKLNTSYIRELINRNPSVFQESEKEPQFFTDRLRIAPNTRILLPLGIKFDIPEGYVVLGFDKSGIAHKKGLHLISGVIDSGYQGEIMVNLLNTSQEPVEILEHSKIAQLLILPIFTPSLERVEEENLHDIASSRGDGGYGSTGI